MVIFVQSIVFNIEYGPSLICIMYVYQNTLIIKRYHILCITIRLCAILWFPLSIDNVKLIMYYILLFHMTDYPATYNRINGKGKWWLGLICYLSSL